MPTATHPARWWKPMPDGRVHCYLCPRNCHLSEGQRGFCYIRQNVGGELIQDGYGRPAALAVDPIEKKPLFHFHPGSTILSLGTAGCNLGCQFCQNFDISRAQQVQGSALRMTAEEVVEVAIAQGAPSIAFTYNEPTIWAEYAVDIARLAHARGLHTVMVTNGYITREAFFDVYEHMDAANVDLKGFREEFYGKLTLSHLEPVLDTLRWLRRETKVWFEVTNLLIPGANDSAAETRELCEWMMGELGDDVPLHFTAFHPDYKMQDRPPTPPETIHRARQLALERGLKYVYEGNINTREGGTTRCPQCNRALIKRSWHSIEQMAIVGGRCPHCGAEIAGRWD
jgi:pyruvate formate lyase activating enzyme